MAHCALCNELITKKDYQYCRKCYFEKLIKCQFCDHRSINELNNKSHENEKHGLNHIIELICSICGKMCDTKSKLKFHKYNSHNKHRKEENKKRANRDRIITKWKHDKTILLEDHAKLDFGTTRGDSARLKRTFREVRITANEAVEKRKKMQLREEDNEKEEELRRLKRDIEIEKLKQQLEKLKKEKQEQDNERHIEFLNRLNK